MDDSIFETIGQGVVVGLAVVVIVGVIALISAFPTMWLWNWLMPTIFGLPKISFLQALGLMLLAWFLFGSRSASTKK